MSSDHHPHPNGADLFPTGGGSTHNTDWAPTQRLLDRYELQERIGVGGMGEVWSAIDHDRAQECALKRLLPALLQDARSVARFQREIEIVQSLSHPHLLQLHEIHLNAGFFVMERLHGQTLRSYLQRHKRMDAWKLTLLLRQLCEALESVHEGSLIHRDIKPENIFLCDTPHDLTIKLLDFGIARPTGESHVTTTTQGILGTPYYLAPELLTGQGTDSITPKADVYSIGVVLYEALTGELPMVGSPPLLEAVEELIEDNAMAAAECPPESKDAYRQLLQSQWQPLYRQAVHRRIDKRLSLAQLHNQARQLWGDLLDVYKAGGQTRRDQLKAQLTSPGANADDLHAALHHARLDYPMDAPLWYELATQLKEAEESGTLGQAQQEWLTWTMHTGYTHITRDSTQSCPLYIHVKASTQGPSKRAPMTLLFCLDNSSSMQGEPMELVLTSVRLVCEQLQPQDRLGLVSFASEAINWMSPAYFNDTTRQQALQLLNKIQAAGATAMGAGLELAFAQLPPQRDEELTRILLLSDGCPNIGRQSATDLASLTRTQRRHATVSTFGFGTEHDETILQAIAKAGGGGYTYIDSADTAPTAFALELGSMMSTVAKRATLVITPMEHCTIKGLKGDNESRFTHRGMEVPLGDFMANQTKELMLELDVDGHRITHSPHVYANVRLEYIAPESNDPIALQHNLTIDIGDQRSPLDHTIARELLLHDVGEAWQRATSNADRGDYTSAVHILTPLLQRLKQHPDWNDQSSKVRDWFEQLTDDVTLYEQRPDSSFYQGYRKMAKAEMQMPGDVTGTAQATSLAATPMQRSMVEQFRLDEHHTARIVVQQQGEEREFPLHGEAVIGRVSSNDIILASSTVSRRHSKIVPSQRGYLLIDMQSSGGTFLNGQRIQHPQLLKDGDLFKIGNVQLKYFDQ